jgi:hypothetical protein
MARPSSPACSLKSSSLIRRVPRHWSSRPTRRGFAIGSWRITRDAAPATLTVETLKRISKKEKNAVADEGVRLLDFVAAGAGTKDVRFVSPEG